MRERRNVAWEGTRAVYNISSTRRSLPCALDIDHVVRPPNVVHCGVCLRCRCRCFPSTSQANSDIFSLSVTPRPSATPYHREHTRCRCQRAVVNLRRVVKSVRCVFHEPSSDGLSLKPGLFQGDLVYSRFFDQNVIIINSEKIAKALLEERSSNYADRPHLVTNTL